MITFPLITTMIRTIRIILVCIHTVRAVFGGTRAGLYGMHSRQMHRAYDVKGAYERWLQNILNMR